jgi:diguanylate cyclase (GGDEF)-like protein/PAS domain S-box-containing protein
MDDNKVVINLADVMELMLDAVCVVDKFGCFVFVSAGFEHIFGYTPQEVIGRNMVEFVYPEDTQRTLDTVDTILSGQLQRRFENRWVRKDGKVVNILWSARWSEEHQVRIAVAHDITERKEMEASLLYAAGHDDLTKLPNRTLLLDRLQTALILAERERTMLSVLFIDIDGFKAVNDDFGHIMGDKLLLGIAKRLKSCIRKSDTVGRLGGDEFLIVLHNTHKTVNAQRVADKIRTKLALPFIIEGTQLEVSSSIGIASYPESGTTPLELVQLADQAMYQAKKNGGDEVISYLPL